MKNRIPVFYYHSIGGVGPETLPLPQFQAHLDALKLRGYHTLTAKQLFSGEYDASQKNALLTFDDGLLDNYEHAFPLIQDYGFVATFYVVPAFDTVTRWVHPGKRKWSNVPKAGYTIPFENMQPHHRRELHEAGMEIGSHTYTHPKLHRIARTHLKHEIMESKQFLEDELGAEVETFCYPYGGYNKYVAQLVAEAGYKGAFTTWPGYFNPRQSQYETNRFLIEDLRSFERILDQRLPWTLSYVSNFLYMRRQTSKVISV